MQTRGRTGGGPSEEKHAVQPESKESTEDLKAMNMGEIYFINRLQKWNCLVRHGSQPESWGSATESSDDDRLDFDWSRKPMMQEGRREDGGGGSNSQ